MKKKFIVKGMSCASCVAHVEKAVKKLNDANDVNVSLLNNSLELETSTLTDEEIMKAVKKAGFKISREDNSYLNESNIKKSKLIISVILLILLLYIAMGHMMNLPLPDFLLKSENALYFALTQVIVLIPIIILNFNYFSSGYTKLIRKSPNMDSLVAVGSSASILYGIFAIVMICIGISNKDYDLVEKYKCDLYF